MSESYKKRIRKRFTFKKDIWLPFITTRGFTNIMRLGVQRHVSNNLRFHFRHVLEHAFGRWRGVSRGGTRSCGSKRNSNCAAIERRAFHRLGGIFSPSAYLRTAKDFKKNVFLLDALSKFKRPNACKLRFIIFSNRLMLWHYCCAYNGTRCSVYKLHANTRVYYFFATNTLFYLNGINRLQITAV